jgi:hypothetical protein
VQERGLFMKKVCKLFLVFVLSISLLGNYVGALTQDNKFDSLFNELVTEGFTNEESSMIVDGYKLYLSNNLGRMNMDNGSEGTTLNCFPSNPRNGTRCRSRFRISNAQLGFPLTGAGILSISRAEVARRLLGLIGSSHTAGVLIAAGAIIAVFNQHNGFNGFIITLNYTFGPDNHLSVSWTTGSISAVTYR